MMKKNKMNNLTINNLTMKGLMILDSIIRIEFNQIFLNDGGPINPYRDTKITELLNYQKQIQKRMEELNKRNE